MNCIWTEETAYRLADGSLDTAEAQAFSNHLADCPACRQAVEAARQLEDLLSANITMILPPVSLLYRIAGAMADPANRPRFAWLLGSGGHNRLRVALACLALILVIGAGAFLIAPNQVAALVQRAMVFIPGLGIKPVTESNIAAPGPVSVKLGQATFTVKALLSDGKQTTVKFKMTGLPGGKEGWNQSNSDRTRQPFLREASGKEYPMTFGYGGVGGSPDENVIEGDMFFAPLAAGLPSIELVVPPEYLAPPAVLQGIVSGDIVVQIPLIALAQGHFPEATPLTASATVNGIKLWVAASNVGKDGTVLLVKGTAGGQDRLLSLHRMALDPIEQITLQDDTGHVYPMEPDLSAGQSGDISGNGPFQQNLFFEPPLPAAKGLTLTISRVQVLKEGSAKVTVPLKGRGPGDVFSLDRTVQFGSHKLELQSASLVEQDGKPWLYIDVDLGPVTNGVTELTFVVENGSSTVTTMMQRSDSQMLRFGAEIPSGADELTIEMAQPVVVVEGPWQISFPVGAR